MHHSQVQELFLALAAFLAARPDLGDAVLDRWRPGTLSDADAYPEDEVPEDLPRRRRSPEGRAAAAHALAGRRHGAGHALRGARWGPPALLVLRERMAARRAHLAAPRAREHATCPPGEGHRGGARSRHRGAAARCARVRAAPRRRRRSHAGGERRSARPAGDPHLGGRRERARGPRARRLALGIIGDLRGDDRRAPRTARCGAACSPRGASR